MISHESLLKEGYLELTNEPLKTKRGFFCPLEIMFKEYNGLGEIIKENDIKDIRVFGLDNLDSKLENFCSSNTYRRYKNHLEKLTYNEKIELTKKYEFWIIYGKKN